ncbi:hypothetical protein D9M68_268150 [compost metagenome]
MLTQILEGGIHAIAQMISYPSCHADAAGISGAFERGGDIDAIAEDIAVFHQNVADIDPDAEVHLPVVGKRLVGTPHRLLNGDCAVEGMDDRWKFRQHAVAGGPENLTMGAFDKTVDNSAVRRQSRKRLLFVGIHQAGITFDIGRKDRCKFSFKWWRLHVNGPIQRLRFHCAVEPSTDGNAALFPSAGAGSRLC